MAKITDKYKYENVESFINTTDNNSYLLLTPKTEYKKASKTKIKIKHLTCNNEFEVITHHFVSDNNRCPYCNKAKYFSNKTQEQFEKDVFNCVGNEYTVVGKYSGTHRKIDLLHNKCGNIYSVTPDHFLSTGCRCTYCRQTSRGEANIKFLLESSNIDFVREYHFQNLWNEQHTAILEFDFAIFENNHLKLLIEFDGIQHFKPIFPANGTDEEKEKQFEITKKNDERKNKYCKEHNIPLLRINYKDRDKKKIAIILNKVLERLNDYPETEYTKK